MTMRTYSEERRSGTIELLLTSPLTDLQIVLGKFLGAITLYAVMLSVTVVHTAVLFIYGQPELKPILTAYLGLLLLGAVFIACGLAASAASQSQMVSAMLTYGVLALSWYASWNEAAMSESLTPLVRAVSLFDHYAGFTQGVLDSRSVVYFLCVTAFFLFLAVRALGVRAWRGIA